MASAGGAGEARAEAIGRAKADLRRELRAWRAAEPEAPAESERRTAAALDACLGHAIVACYASAGDEPDTWSLIERMQARGQRVLLPLLGRRPDGSVRRQPDWGFYQGRDRLRAGFRGILEPNGVALGEEALGKASFIWCSALAATLRGDRLGTGGRWYDRALGWSAPTARVAVLLRDREILPEVPIEPWDRRVGLLVTERRVHACPE